MRLAFIMGCGHTGTTLLATMLAAHSEIYTPFVETWSYMYKEHAWLLPTLLRESQGRKESVFLEKTPKHIYHVNKIKQDHNPHFIFCVRNGYDTIASLEKRWDFDKGYDRYIKDTFETMKHERHGIIIKYENLLSNPGKELKRICKHIELPYEKQMLKYYEMDLPQWTDMHNNKNALMRFEQVKKPIYKPVHDINYNFIRKCHTDEFNQIMRHYNYELLHT